MFGTSTHGCNFDDGAKVFSNGGAISSSCANISDNSGAYAAARDTQYRSIFRSGVRVVSGSSVAMSSSCAIELDNSEDTSDAQHFHSRTQHCSRTYPIFGVDGQAAVEQKFGRGIQMQVTQMQFDAGHFDASVRQSLEVNGRPSENINSIRPSLSSLPMQPIYSINSINSIPNFKNFPNRLMPNHQALSYDIKSHTYSKHTLLTHRPKTNIKQTQLLMTSTLSNNQINNYNLEHTQNRIRNISSTKATHYRTRFKHNTYSTHSNCKVKQNAFRGDSPRTGAAAPPRGINWKVPRYSCTLDPLGSDAPLVQLHPGALGTLLESKSTTTAVSTTTANNTLLHNTQAGTQEPNPRVLPNPLGCIAQQQQQHTHTKTHTETQGNISNNQTHNNNNNKNMEPYSQFPSRGSTGQPRSFEQFSGKENSRKTCGDQKQPTQPPRERNTNRGLRNANTIEIRREKRTNKRRVARRKNRKKEGGGKTLRTHRGFLRPRPRNPLNLK